MNSRFVFAKKRKKSQKNSGEWKNSGEKIQNEKIQQKNSGEKIQEKKVTKRFRNSSVPESARGIFILLRFWIF